MITKQTKIKVKEIASGSTRPKYSNLLLTIKGDWFSKREWKKGKLKRTLIPGF